MGKRGPAPKPTQLKLFQGNPGNRPLNKGEPKPAVEENTKAPDWLSPKFQAKDFDPQDMWKSLSADLEKIGLLTIIDKIAFARYCDMLAEWLRARDFIKKNGTSYSTFNPPDTPGGEPELKYRGQWPEVAIYRNLANSLLRMEQEFGLTPASRSRVIGAVQDSTADEWEEFLFGNIK